MSLQVARSAKNINVRIGCLKNSETFESSKNNWHKKVRNQSKIIAPWQCCVTKSLLINCFRLLRQSFLSLIYGRWLHNSRLSLQLDVWLVDSHHDSQVCSTTKGRGQTDRYTSSNNARNKF